jgi:hypothetical protein
MRPCLSEFLWLFAATVIMRRTARVAFTALAVILLACGGHESDYATGDERGACYPNGTCNAGLSCFSNKCVRYDAGAGGNDAGEAAGASTIEGGGPAGSGGVTGTGGSGTPDAEGTPDVEGTADAGGATGAGGAAGTGGTLEASTIDVGGVNEAGSATGDASDPACPRDGGALDNVTVPSCGQPGAASREAYAGIVSITVSGIIQGAPGVPQDAFYAVNPNDDTQATNACAGCLVFNRFSEGSCVCPVECSTASHRVADILLGAYPAFNPTHVYTVQLDLGQVAADRINFAFGDCGCYDNAGSYGLTISTQAVSACAD